MLGDTKPAVWFWQQVRVADILVDIREGFSSWPTPTPRIQIHANEGMLY